MNEPCFHKSLLKHSGFLNTVAQKFARTREDAEDLLQETFCKALIYQEKFKAGSDLGAWLYVIMRNIFINKYRRRRKFAEIIYAPADKQSSNHGISKSSHQDILSRNILIQIHKLPELFKVPFVLHLEGYKYAEIANMLNEPIGTIKSRIHFARQILKNVIERG
ncbi:RNA polymerase sigma factor [Danxiaibacter flavus]|uniref:RNA polymerase sigma factor n=1 Tax=Danxiaibacter flavus TaxID=3049108 RepID=A0ABV3ZIE1_9BACT|nr:RNA polymerase sigma factor [Chitinophagaceae bacterium DXS]